MGKNTKIGWTATILPDGTLLPGFTFNPWIGCTKVSAGCAHCYAESQNERYGWNKAGWGKGAPRHRTSETNWRQPLKWDKQAERDGVTRRVFCASLADVLDDEAPNEWRADLWALIEQTPHLEWLLLTKRPENIEDMLPAAWIANPPNNVRLGVTVEDQAQAMVRIPKLLNVWQGKNFLSIEPILGPLELSWWLEKCPECGESPKLDGCWRWEGQNWAHHHQYPIGHIPTIGNNAIHWVIVGGESGAGCRTMNVNAAISLAGQCHEAGVKFFFKQLGGFPDKRDQPEQWPEELRVQEFPN